MIPKKLLRKEHFAPDEKKLSIFGGLWSKKYAADIQNLNLDLQAKANLDVNNLLGETTHLVDPKIRKTPARSLYGDDNSTFHSSP